MTPTKNASNNRNILAILLLQHVLFIYSQQEQTIFAETFSSSTTYNQWGIWCDVTCQSWHYQLVSGSDCVDKFQNNGCLVIRGWTTFHQQFSLIGYKDIRVEFDVYTSMTNANDYCAVYYRLGQHVTTASGLITVAEEHRNGMKYHHSQTLSPADDAPQFELYLWNENPDESMGDECWFDNVYIYATPIATPSPTLIPTSSPVATKTPTKTPSKMPTSIPTSTPTKDPTQKPTASPTISTTVNCQQAEDCQCPSTSECIFNCQGSAQCASTNFATAYDNQDITINCIGSSACYGLTGDLSSASSVTWNCAGQDACKDAHLSRCGLICELNCNCAADCDNEKSCGNNYFDRINGVFTCNGVLCITPDPTVSPTTDPSISPTLKPSDSPIAEGDPTRAPSAGTPSPSITPTIDPTSDSSSPTKSPSQRPTPSDTEHPSSSPTLEPTVNPTSPSLIEEEPVGDTTVTVEFLAAEWIQQNIALFILIIIGLITLCCMPIVICIYCYKMKDRHKKRENKHQEPDNIIMTSTTSTKSRRAGEGGYSVHHVERVASVESIPSPSSNQNLPQQPELPSNWQIDTPNFESTLSESNGNKTTLDYPKLPNDEANNFVYNNSDSDSDQLFDGAMTANNISSPSPFSSGLSKKQKSENGVGHRINRRRRKETYMTWNYDQICNWILSIHNGLFMKYEAVLRGSLRECNLKGRSLKMVNSTDIMDWGIKDFEHRKLLRYYIHELINSDKNLGNLTVEGNAEMDV